MKPKKIERPGAIICKQMIEAAFTMGEFATLLDKKYGAVYAILRGSDNRKLSLDFAQKCAVIFGVTPETYLHQQVAYDLAKYPLSPYYKKNIHEKWKEIERLKGLKNKKKAGRQWKN